MKKPTKEEILNSGGRKKPLLEWSEGFGVEVQGDPTIAELRKNLIQVLYPQGEFVEDKESESSAGNAIQKENKIEKGTLFDQSTEEIKNEFESVSNNLDHQEEQRLLLPVTVDELVQYWQRGFICHPAVVAYLAKRSSQHHERSDISKMITVDLLERHKSSCKVYLDLELKFDNERPVIDHKWISPIRILKGILVDNENTKESVSRSLINSNRNFSEHSLILLYPFNTGGDQAIDNTTDQPEVDDRTLEAFDLLDSLMGGFAVSSHIERVFMFQGRHPNLGISKFGSFYDVIFNSSRLSDLKDLKLIKFLTDRITEKIRSIDVENNEYNSLVESIRTREVEDLEEYIRKLGRRDARASSNELSAYHEALEENFLVDAIKAIPKRKTKDPFLLFYAFLNKYKNVNIPASGDRQSFLFAIKDLVESEDLETEEAILLSFLLGYHIGYGICWDPVSKDEDEEWNEEHWYKDLLFPTTELTHVLENIIDRSGFRLQTATESEPPTGSEPIIRSNSKKTERRSLKFMDGSMTIEDRDLTEFRDWRQKDLDGAMFHHFMAFRKEPSLEATITAIYNNLKGPEGTYDQIERGLKQGKFSLAERKVISALSNFIPNGKT